MADSSRTAKDDSLDALLAPARDLTATPLQLQQLGAQAAQHPELIAPLLAHPNMYPQLAQWLRELQPEEDSKRSGLVGPAATGIGTAAATTTGLAAAQVGAGAGATAASTDAAGIAATAAGAAATKTAAGLTAGKVIAGVAGVADALHVELR
jgi:hypothetical protein